MEQVEILIHQTIGQTQPMIEVVCGDDHELVRLHRVEAVFARLEKAGFVVDATTKKIIAGLKHSSNQLP